MKRLGAILMAATLAGVTAQAQPARPKWAIVVHGGAGVIEKGSLSAAQEKAYREAMARATEAGGAVLRRGGTSLDAIEAAIHLMEDDPLFNAGRGAVFSTEGRNELDASIMDGATLGAGAVAAVSRTRHPISAARAVMEKSPHVFLTGTGADQFSKEQGLEQVDPSYFFTESRWQGLVRFLERQNMPVPPRPAGAPKAPDARSELIHREGKYGTVGVVALDQKGNVAAGTSTGGTNGKRWGRIGDAPVIGAGTYASNTSCAVSATGTGEFFIRLTVARTVCALVEMKGMSLQAAADQVIQKDLTALKGDGGVIAVAPDGQIAWSFNTSGMYRARLSETQPLQIGIYRDDP
jgi:L-asparaginase / beta-aspartyl-peptidase